MRTLRSISTATANRSNRSQERDSIVIFDGTSNFVESAINYELAEDDEIIYRGTYDQCRIFCDRENDKL
jgi:hypothetical protein